MLNNDQGEKSAVFNAKAAATMVLLGAVLTGCDVAPGGPANNPTESVGIIPEACVVLDAAPPGMYPANRIQNAYDFNNGVLTLNAGYRGVPMENSTSVSIKDLAQPGQERAIKMFSYLPASAQCKAPAFN